MRQAAVERKRSCSGVACASPGRSRRIELPCSGPRQDPSRAETSFSPSDERLWGLGSLEGCGERRFTAAVMKHYVDDFVAKISVLLVAS